MVEKLESMDNVMAAELGFAPLLADDIILVAIEMCLGELPLIVCLPEEQILRIGPAAIQMGAAAVSLAAPRGELTADDGRLTEGRLFGPSLFPRTLAIVHAAARLGLPVIGGGGVYKREQAEALKEAGAMAVQLDAVLWRGGYSSIE
jgi:dihydroorotate dehydrogenase